jgi:hypothetical protein
MKNKLLFGTALLIAKSVAKIIISELEKIDEPKNMGKIVENESPRNSDGMRNRPPSLEGCICDQLYYRDGAFKGYKTTSRSCGFPHWLYKD